MTAVAAAKAGWLHRTGSIDLDRPVLMGILNTTPDSFSDGGLFVDADRALEQARRMVSEGAAIVDVGGESTRPGADPVDPDQELERVLPVIRRISAELPVVISIDTRRAEVARVALREGAQIVNDVSGLADPEMAGVVAETEAGLVMMHMRGTPATMQDDPHYDDVAGEVSNELRLRLRAARAARIEPGRIVLDPGIGFAKTAQHNLELLGRLSELRSLGHPILLGVSRKAFLGHLLGGVPPEERVGATAAACVWGLMGGARIFRVHDVRPVREALLVADAIRRATQPAT